MVVLVQIFRILAYMRIGRYMQIGLIVKLLHHTVAMLWHSFIALRWMHFILSLFATMFSVKVSEYKQGIVFLVDQ